MHDTGLTDSFELLGDVHATEVDAKLTDNVVLLQPMQQEKDEAIYASQACLNVTHKVTNAASSTAGEKEAGDSDVEAWYAGDLDSKLHAVQNAVSAYLAAKNKRPCTEAAMLARHSTGQMDDMNIATCRSFSALTAVQESTCDKSLTRLHEVLDSKDKEVRENKRTIERMVGAKRSADAMLQSRDDTLGVQQEQINNMAAVQESLQSLNRETSNKLDRVMGMNEKLVIENTTLWERYTQTKEIADRATYELAEALALNEQVQADLMKERNLNDEKKRGAVVVESVVESQSKRAIVDIVFCNLFDNQFPSMGHYDDNDIPRFVFNTDLYPVINFMDEKLKMCIEKNDRPPESILRTVILSVVHPDKLGISDTKVVTENYGNVLFLVFLIARGYSYLQCHKHYKTHYEKKLEQALECVQKLLKSIDPEERTLVERSLLKTTIDNSRIKEFGREDYDPVVRDTSPIALKDAMAVLQQLKKFCSVHD